MNRHFRWTATITYRSKRGDIVVDHHFEELDELQNIVERGPDWNSIVSINIVLNPKRTTHPGDTIEAAAER